MFKHKNAFLVLLCKSASACLDDLNKGIAECKLCASISEFRLLLLFSTLYC